MYWLREGAEVFMLFWVADILVLILMIRLAGLPKCACHLSTRHEAGNPKLEIRQPKQIPREVNFKNGEGKILKIARWSRANWAIAVPSGKAGGSTPNIQR